MLERPRWTSDRRSRWWSRCRFPAGPACYVADLRANFDLPDLLNLLDEYLEYWAAGSEWTLDDAEYAAVQDQNDPELRPETDQEHPRGELGVETQLDQADWELGYWWTKRE